MWYCVQQHKILQLMATQRSMYTNVTVASQKFAKGNARSTLKQESTYNQKIDSWPDTIVGKFDSP